MTTRTSCRGPGRPGRSTLRRTRGRATGVRRRAPASGRHGRPAGSRPHRRAGRNRRPEVHERVDRVPPGAASLELLPLAHQRPVRELWVASDVVEVQVAVGHGCDVLDPKAGGRQRRVDIDPARPVPGLGLLVVEAETRVEENQGARSPHQVAVDGLDAWSSCPGLLRRTNEGSEGEATDVLDSHALKRTKRNACLGAPGACGSEASNTICSRLSMGSS
jgi:hypothetical protein